MTFRLTRTLFIAAALPLVSAFSLLIAAAGASAASATSQTDLAAAVRLRDTALRSDVAFGVVESLTTEVGPRPAGSAGDAAAVDWAVRKLTELGFANVHTQGVAVPHWVRGVSEFSVITPFPQNMPSLAIGGSIATPDEGLRAEAIKVLNLEELRALPAERVKGKIVFYTQRTERTRDGSGYGRAVRVRGGGASAAAAMGAVGVVIREISTGNNRLPHTGALIYDAAQPRIPAIAIANPDADALERQFATGRVVTLQMKVTARDLPTAHSANVIGEIPGTDKANEIVLLGAHLDSWDPGTGAIDDGAGIAIIVGAARLLRDVDPKPRRTVRVVLFANEEFGGSGSKAYAAAAVPDIDKHVLAMEADLGAGPVWRIQSHVAEADLPWVRQIQKIVAPLGVTIGENQTQGGSDVAPLHALGVPLLGLNLDATEYFDHHHSANDTLDKVDPAKLRQSVAVYAVAAYLATRVETTLGRVSVVPTPAR